MRLLTTSKSLLRPVFAGSLPAALLRKSFYDLEVAR